jgi:hypothetical protein
MVEASKAPNPITCHRAITIPHPVLSEVSRAGYVVVMPVPLNLCGRQEQENDDVGK